MTKKILNTINIKRTMNLNSKSDKISGNIFMKKKTFKLSPKKIKVISFDNLTIHLPIVVHEEARAAALKAFQSLKN